jgi:hypothetical protein
MIRRSDYEALQNQKERQTAKLSEQIQIMEKQHELDRIAIKSA